MSYQARDTTGTRIKWARENLRHVSGKTFATEVGIGQVYLSALENDKRTASSDTLKKIAAALGVSRAFLEKETDDPAPILAQQEELSTYFSPEADEAARLIDEMPDKWRSVALDVVRSVAAHATDDTSWHNNTQT